jgi:hypothetical protein
MGGIKKTKTRGGFFERFHAMVETPAHLGEEKAIAV